jgi:hypothetical protein
MPEQHARGRRLFGEDVEGGARDMPELSASTSACSSTRRPRAQLMMRTPFFIFASAAALMTFLVFSVSGVQR